jgi:cytochrome oxidase Cu insertion factor (SCO1/SenC/PrrC family)
VAVAAAVLVLAASAAYVVARIHQQQESQSLRPTGIPASISTSLANLMQLSPVPARAAPGFTLTDQAGRAISLASLRGHAVVLEFMDSHCVNICPIVSQEFIDAYHDLGAAAPRAVFAAVDVNPSFHRVSDVAAFSAEHQLTTIPSWHFLTGPLPRLRAVWRAYGIEVSASGRNADIVHTSVVYFIDPRGRERFEATPMAGSTAGGKAYLPAASVTAWGRGIALLARHLAH